jgi:hypothetical protein
MVLSPVESRDWTDPAWDVGTPDAETNIMTIARLRNERGRGCHKVVNETLKQFFVSTVNNIVSKLSDSEKTKIDLERITSTFNLQNVYVTINQCMVSGGCPLTMCFCLLCVAISLMRTGCQV